MEDFDVVVVGGGPGGYVAAARAGQLGLRTALIEKDQLGGMCVNWGCIPTKSLLRNAEVIGLLSQGKTYGFTCQDFSANYAAGHNRSRQVARRQGKRVEVLLKNRNVEVFKGLARLEDNATISINPTGEKLSAKNIVLASGSKAREIRGMEFDGDKILCFRDALNLNQLPASVIIIGGGPIGMEFATLWRRYGVDVTVVEMQPHVLPTEDDSISLEAAVQFQKAGINIKQGAKVASVTKTECSVEVTVVTGNVSEKIQAEKVLVAAGFIPNTADLGLETLGVRTSSRGYVEIDESMRTNIPHVYAIGDITGKLGLAHVASAQGILAAEAIAALPPRSLVYENIPRCVFGCVEVASVGLTEKQAYERGYHVKSAISPFVPNGKAVAMAENSGFVKLIADETTNKLLGAHMIGPCVTELIAGPATVIAFGGTVEQLSQTVYAHPTLSEAVLEGAHLLCGRAVHL